MNKINYRQFLIKPGLLFILLLSISTTSAIETKYVVNYTMENSKVNTNKKEDGVSLLKDSFAYTNANKTLQGFHKENLDFDTAIIHHKWSQFDIEGQFTQTPQGSVIFSHEGKLYIAKSIDGKNWENPKKLTIEGMGKRRVTMRGSSLFYRSWRYPEEDAIVMYNPHLSNDGKRLYYASNYYGTKGKLDIWYSEMINGKEDEWTEPTNLGESVNTESDENYPFIFDNYLYFSSEKTDSLKGSNIYKHTFASNESVLLPEPFNSNADDYNMVGDGNYLFLISTRAGNPDIYYPAQIEIANADSTQTDSIADGIDADNSLTDNRISSDNNGENGENNKIKFPDINTCILYFIFDQDNFISDYQKELEIIMNFIHYHNGAKFKITGHTDTRGTVEYNQRLSERRADKLKRILMERGIESNRLKTVGRSELELAIPDAKSEKEHQLNRRVVIEKLDK